MKNKKKSFFKFLIIITILLSNILAYVIPSYAATFKSSSNYSKPSVSSSYNSTTSQGSKSNSRFNTSNKYNNNNSTKSNGNTNSKFNTSDKYNNNNSSKNNSSNSNNDNSNNKNTTQTPNMNTGDYNSRRRSISFFPSFSFFRPHYGHSSSFMFKAIIALFVIAIIIFIAYHMFIN